MKTHIIYDSNEDSEDGIYYEDEVGNLSKILDGRIIAIADMGLWNGRVTGYKIGRNNLNEIMRMGNEDYVKIYSDGHNIRKDSTHHDGTNHILFREVRENRKIENFTELIFNGKPISNAVLNYYTKSINFYVSDIYGWSQRRFSGGPALPLTDL